MKKILIYILSTALIATLAACGPISKDKSSNSAIDNRAAAAATDDDGESLDFSDENESLDSSDDEEEKRTAVKTTPAKISDEISDLEFSLNGVAYQLPVKVSEFSKNGWEIEEEYADEKYTPGGRSLFSILKDDVAVSVKAENFGIDTLGVEDLYIVGLSFDSYNNIPDVVFAKGITLESTAVDIEKLLGAADPDTSGDEHKWYHFTTILEAEDEFEDENEEIDKGTFTFYINLEAEGDDYELNSIVMNSELEPPAEELPAPKYAGEIPSSVTDYKEPASLGSKFDDYSIKLDGVIYQMPAPVSVFIENGWKAEEIAYFRKADDITEKLNSYLFPAKSSSFMKSLDLVKGDLSISVGISNNNDIGQPILNCSVTYISMDTENASFELPGGIGSSSTIDNIKSAYGTPATEDDGNLVYGEYPNELELSFQDEVLDSIIYRMDILNTES